jgi:hypothetical protein
MLELFGSFATLPRKSSGLRPNALRPVLSGSLPLSVIGGSLVREVESVPVGRQASLAEPAAGSGAQHPTSLASKKGTGALAC